MRLNQNHKDEVRRLVESNTSRIHNGYAIDSGVNHLVAEYLGSNPLRMLFGSVIDGKLICMAGLRVNYPIHGTGIVCNFFADQEHQSTRDKIHALNQVYEYAENHGITTLFSSVMADRYKSQIDIGLRYGENVRNFNCFGVAEYVVAGEKPSQEWMWVLMGMRPAPGDVVIRQITQDGGHSFRQYEEERRR